MRLGVGDRRQYLSSGLGDPWLDLGLGSCIFYFGHLGLLLVCADLYLSGHCKVHYRCGLVPKGVSLGFLLGLGWA